MSDGPYDAYKADLEYDNFYKKLLITDDKAININEYKELINASILICHILKKQIKIYNKIRRKRVEILHQCGINIISQELDELDNGKNRNILSKCQLKDLII